MIRTLINGLVLALVVSPQTLANAPLVDSKGEEIRIVRDPWGVPHIFAATDRGAAGGRSSGKQ